MPIAKPWAHLRFVATQVLYDLRHGLLFRPLMWTAALALAALLLPWVDGAVAARGWLPPWLGAGEPATAQTLLATIASAMMTTVSVVYSVLVVALTLASVQFSPRILGRFLGAASSQNTIGCFVGTFVYCLLVLRAVRSGDGAVVPQLSVGLALLLALLALGLLIYAIHGLAVSIQANHIAADIAAETRDVLDACLDPSAAVEPLPSLPAPPCAAVAVLSPASGYLQLIGEDELAGLAAQSGVTLLVVVRPGRFVVQGEPLAVIWPPAAWDPAHAQAVAAAFDLGAVRTMQQDAEFGLRQLVDMALKAISPAVNDPSTACTCIDQLTALLCHAVRLPERSPRVAAGAGALWMPRTQTAELIDLAVQQLRQYGAADVAVCLRLARLLTSVHAAAVRPADRERLVVHARWLAERAGQAIADHDREALDERLRPLLAGGPAARTGVGPLSATSGSDAPTLR